MLRDIIKIDEELCNGCGNCVPGCHEGALQIIDGKARLISEIMCDGLGACVGHCPTGAMTVVKRESAPYDEVRVMRENIIPAGRKTIEAHLAHLREHGETAYLAQALAVLQEAGLGGLASATGMIPAAIAPADAATPAAFSPVGAMTPAGPATPPGPGYQPHVPGPGMTQGPARSACPGSAARSIINSRGGLNQWPVQLHLVNPAAPYFRGSDLLLAADCSAYALQNFQEGYLGHKSLAIACPKLDQGMESYARKLEIMIRDSGLNSISVLMMEVPCCSGLLQLALHAVAASGKKIPVKKIVVSIEGELLQEEWV